MIISVNRRLKRRHAAAKKSEKEAADPAKSAADKVAKPSNEEKLNPNVWQEAE
jgi:hypothetical protein